LAPPDVDLQHLENCFSILAPFLYPPSPLPSPYPRLHKKIENNSNAAGARTSRLSPATVIARRDAVAATVRAIHLNPSGEKETVK
jgi:hypothetical protein